MLRTLVATVIGILVLGLAPAAAAGAEAVDLADLLADPARYSAPEVPLIRVRGELVGDFGHRGSAVWCQLNDDSYADRPILDGGPLAGGNLAIGVRIPLVLWEDVGAPGGYRHRGAVVELTGAWRYHDGSRGGESYLDVTGFGLVAPEQPLREDLSWLPFTLGIAMSAIAGATWWWNRRRLGT